PTGGGAAVSHGHGLPPRRGAAVSATTSVARATRPVAQRGVYAGPFVAGGDARRTCLLTGAPSGDASRIPPRFVRVPASPDGGPAGDLAMPRPRELPSDDCLLSAAEAGAICKVSRSRFD